MRSRNKVSVRMQLRPQSDKEQFAFRQALRVLLFQLSKAATRKSNS